MSTAVKKNNLMKNLIVLSFYYCKPEEFMVPTTYQSCQSGQGTGAGNNNNNNESLFCQKIKLHILC